VGSLSRVWGRPAALWGGGPDRAIKAPFEVSAPRSWLCVFVGCAGDGIAEVSRVVATREAAVLSPDRAR